MGAVLDMCHILLASTAYGGRGFDMLPGLAFFQIHTLRGKRSTIHAIRTPNLFSFVQLLIRFI
jgi:hypothetical protein